MRAALRQEAIEPSGEFIVEAEHEAVEENTLQHFAKAGREGNGSEFVEAGLRNGNYKGASTPVTCCLETNGKHCGGHSRRHSDTNLLICIGTCLSQC